MQQGKFQQMALAALQNRTTARVCRKKFVEIGGLEVLNVMLQLQKKKTLILALLDTLSILPVTVEVLKQSQIGKTIKALSRTADPDIPDQAQKIMASWLSLLSDGPNKRAGYAFVFVSCCATRN